MVYKQNVEEKSIELLNFAWLVTRKNNYGGMSKKEDII